VKTPSRAVTGPGMMVLGRAQAQGSPPGVKNSVNMRVKRRTQKVAWKVMIGDCMSSGENKSVKSGDIFGSVVAKKRKPGRDEEVVLKRRVLDGVSKS